MRTRKLLTICFVVLFVAFGAIATMPMATLKVFAGNSRETLLDDTAAFNGSNELANLWINRDDSHIAYNTASGTVIRWDESTDTSSTLVLRTQPTVSEGWDDVVLSIETTFTVTSIAGDKQFGVYLSVPRLDFKAEEATAARYRGATYVYVEKHGDGKFYAGATYFGETEIGLTSNFLVGSGTNSTINFLISLYGNGRMTAKCGSGTPFAATGNLYDSDTYNADKAEDAKVSHGIGLFALGGRGVDTNVFAYHVVDFKHVNIINYYESTPSNFNAYETFDNDYINAEKWFIKGTAYVGEGMFNFVNANVNTFLRTRYWFSNFEMSFDIPKIRRLPVYDTDGTMLYESCHQFVIVFGLNDSDPDTTESFDWGPYNQYQLAFYPSMGEDSISRGTYLYNSKQWNSRKVETLVNLGKRNTGNLEDMRLDLFNPINEGRTYCVKVRMADGILQVYLKWQDEEEYTLVLNKDLGFTPEGFVGIYCGYNPDQRCSFSIDNLSITNLDGAPQFGQIGFSESGIPNKGDYIWTDTRNSADLHLNEVDATGTIIVGGKAGETTFFGASKAVGFVVLAVSVITLAAGIVLFIFKEGGKKNEK